LAASLPDGHKNHHDPKGKKHTAQRHEEHPCHLPGFRGGGERAAARTGALDHLSHGPHGKRRIQLRGRLGLRGRTRESGKGARAFRAHKPRRHGPLPARLVLHTRSTAVTPRVALATREFFHPQGLDPDRDGGARCDGAARSHEREGSSHANKNNAASKRGNHEKTSSRIHPAHAAHFPCMQRRPGKVRGL
jgi:hypothetical protein